MLSNTSLPRRQRPSDPILPKSCNCSTGYVILFYGYTHITQLKAFETLHQEWINSLRLYGKVRLSKEGFNITVGGNEDDIINYCTQWCGFIKELGSKNGLGENLLAPDLVMLAKEDLNGNNNMMDKTNDLLWGNIEKVGNSWVYNGDKNRFFKGVRYNYFKPTPGCEHAFDGLSIKSVDEICPLGVKNLPLGLKWHSELKEEADANLEQESLIQRIKLSPSEFHEKLTTYFDDGNTPLILDVRNYYESKIGKFQNAITPNIRNFKALPEYLNKTQDLSNHERHELFTYCTGGIRCEKATSYIQHHLKNQKQNSIQKIYMLEGGIHNYLEWYKNNFNENQKCLFLGRNYIFDARQSTSLNDYSIHQSNNNNSDNNLMISSCSNCNQPSSYFYKCKSQSCHKLIIRCSPNLNSSVSSFNENNDLKFSSSLNCFDQLPYCCNDCKVLDELCQFNLKKRDRLCQCEKERVKRL